VAWSAFCVISIATPGARQVTSGCLLAIDPMAQGAIPRRSLAPLSARDAGRYGRPLMTSAGTGLALSLLISV
jgi:hypothetical protein